MYMMKLDEEQVREMYYIREEMKKYGVKKPISKQVREAIEKHIREQKEKLWENADD